MPDLRLEIGCGMVTKSELITEYAGIRISFNISAIKTHNITTNHPIMSVRLFLNIFNRKMIMMMMVMVLVMMK